MIVDRRSGARRFIVPDRRKLEARAPALDLSSIGPRSIVLVDGHFPDQARRALRRARQVGATVIADFNRPRREWLRLLPYVDYPVVPAEFGQAWGSSSPRDTLEALRARSGGTPVITQGRRGALALIDGRFRRVASRKVRVRDTTGAGDAFHGAFAAGLAHGLGVLEALELAARAGATNCTAVGGTAGLLRIEAQRAEYEPDQSARGADRHLAQNEF